MTRDHRDDDRARAREVIRLYDEAERVAGIGSFEYRVSENVTTWSDQLFRVYGMDPARDAPLTQESFDELLDPDDHEIGAELIRDMRAGGPYSADLRVTRMDGVERTLHLSGYATLDDAGALQRANGTVQDVTDARAKERQLRRGEAQQAVVARLSQQGLQGMPADQLFAGACEGLVRAVGADGAGVLELRPDGVTLRLVAGSGVPPGAVGTELPLASETMSTRALAADQPVIVDDWRNDQRFDPPTLVGDREVRSAAAVPIRTREGHFGSLGAYSYAPGHFGEETADFILSLANVLAAAIERRSGEQQIEALAAQRGRLVAQTVDAEERVRRRVSEAIHDGALQNLLAARQDLVEAAEDSAAKEKLVGRARQGIERAVDELREAVQALHPLVLQHGGLEAALSATADHSARGGGFQPRVAVDHRAAGLWDELVLSLARELLTNTAKHARAGAAWVNVELGEDGVVLEVSDDGLGIAPGALAAAPREGHIGLASVAERVEAVGGRFEIASPRSGGTTVRAVLPLPAD